MHLRTEVPNATRRIVHTVLVAVAAAALATACAAGEASEQTAGERADPTDHSTVTLTAVSFAPADLVVEAGSTVTWVWEGGVAHDVSGDGFRSPVQSEGDFQHTFDEVGVQPYRCNLHGGMQGTVTVVQP